MSFIAQHPRLRLGLIAGTGLVVIAAGVLAAARLDQPAGSVADLTEQAAVSQAPSASPLIIEADIPQSAP